MSDETLWRGAADGELYSVRGPLVEGYDGLTPVWVVEGPDIEGVRCSDEGDAYHVVTALELLAKQPGWTYPYQHHTRA